MKRIFVAALLTVSVIFSFVACSVEREVPPDIDFTSEVDINEIKRLYPSKSNVPVMYIELDRSLWAVNKEEYVNATITVPDCGIIEAEGGIKGRGNASWGLPQKPYNIKFSEKADMFGMGAAKKWVLITLFYDKTLLRNYLTLNLAKTVSAGPEMDCRFVEVFFNGEYNGLYLLTEKVEDDDERVDIKKKNGDVIFEIEQEYRHEYQCKNCISLRSGVHLTFKDPEPKDLSLNEMKKLHSSMQSFMNDVDQAIRSDDYKKYTEYIDVDSFVNWYIVNEFVKNFDSQFVTSCYCYVKNGKLYMGPCWDYDTCYGNQDVATCMDPKGYHVRNAPWFNYLMRNDEFFSLVCGRWQELVEDGVFDKMLENIDEQTEYLSSASANQFDRWRDSLKSTDLRGKKSLFTYNDELDYLKNWISGRVNWLNTKWAVQ
ncbi:MAG: CotH kinase family protein [Clostridia bacterium]|nr:CotH kinase family protein [Clostridia bacterium]